MARLQLTFGASRAYQLTFAIVVLSLSIVASYEIRTQRKDCAQMTPGLMQEMCQATTGDWPGTPVFTIFCGSFGVFDALFGFLPGYFYRKTLVWISVAADIVALLLYAVSGSILASHAGKTHEQMQANCINKGPAGQLLCEGYAQAMREQVLANVILIFLAFVFTVGALVFLLLVHRSQRQVLKKE